LIAALVVIGLIVSAAEHHPAAFTLVVVGLLAGAVWWWRNRRNAAAREEAARVAALAAEKKWWRELPFPEGSCTVKITSVKNADERLYGFLLNLSENANERITVGDADQLLQRAEHIGPQVVAAGITESFAVELKVALEDRGAKVKIGETAISKGNGRREPIPERVRHEVWRRDGGQCVDCGSRERLEFDHIVPFSKGGSNTTRNLELLCEVCNRKKAATI